MIKSVFLATCKERQLRRRDPNLADEFHSFEAYEYKNTQNGPSSITSWKDTKGEHVLLAEPGKAPILNDNTNKPQFVSARMYPDKFLYMENNHVLGAAEPDGELYIRIRAYHISFENKTTPMVLFCTPNQLKVELIEVPPPEGSGSIWKRYVVTWVDREGTDFSFEIPFSFQNNQERQIKLFFWQRKAEAVVTDYSGKIEWEGEIGDSQYIAKSTERHYLCSDDGVTGSFNGLVHRLGYGNNITTRPPPPFGRA